jgi:hypothetical protein
VQTISFSCFYHKKYGGLAETARPPIHISNLRRGGLALNDSASGASASAGAARNASVLVNLVDVAFADSSNGAFASASAASYASVSNFVSHFVFVF